MRQKHGGDSDWHRGPRIDAIPVAGVGGLIFAVGMVFIFAAGLRAAKWFFIASLPAGLVALVAIRMFRRLRPQTEEEEVELNIEPRNGDGSR